MKLTNPWLGYIDRGYKQIKNSLITKLRTLVPEVTDTSEGNILVVIISMFSGLGEMLNFYIDNNARESYLATARKFASVVKLVQILDYRIKAKLPASADLYITYLDINGNPETITQQGVIPAGTIIRTSNGIPFMTTKTVIVQAGQSFGALQSKQWEKILDDNLGTTTSEPNQKFALPLNYSHNSLELSIDDVPWLLKNTLARSKSTDRHFVVNIGEDKVAFIQFGNGINGALPPANSALMGDYYVTEGVSGNDVSSNTITEVDSDLVLPTPAVGLKITNPDKPIAGADVESIEDIRINAPYTIRTLLRAVTPQDFKDLVIQADGVAKVDVIYSGGAKVQIYIAPNGGGIASQSLIDETQAFVDDVRILNRKAIVSAAGVTPVVVEMNILTRFRADKVQAKLDIENELGTRFSFDNQDINGRIAMSDITAAVDNLDRVDTVDITGLYTLPYPIPKAGTAPLNWERRTLLTSNIEAKWKIVYTGTDFRVYFNASYIANVNYNQVYVDPQNLITFKILPSSYSIGDSWEFKSYTANKTLKLTDNTIPVIISTQTTVINLL
jgi:hypothetical protein